MQNNNLIKIYIKLSYTSYTFALKNRKHHFIKRCTVTAYMQWYNDYLLWLYCIIHHVRNIIIHSSYFDPLQPERHMSYCHLM